MEDGSFPPPVKRAGELTPQFSSSDLAANHLSTAIAHFVFGPRLMRYIPSVMDIRSLERARHALDPELGPSSAGNDPFARLGLEADPTERANVGNDDDLLPSLRLELASPERLLALLNVVRPPGDGWPPSVTASVRHLAGLEGATETYMAAPIRFETEKNIPTNGRDSRREAAKPKATVHGKERTGKVGVSLPGPG